MFYDDADPDFSEEHLQEILTDVKQSVKRRRGMTALPSVVAITFGIAAYLVLLQPSSSSVAVVSTDDSSVPAEAAFDTTEALAASGSTTDGTGGFSYEPDSTPATAAAAADDGSSNSLDASASQASYRSRVAIGFDNTTLTETATDLGPTSPPPKSTETGSVEWFESPWQRLAESGPGALVGNAPGAGYLADPSTLSVRGSKIAAASEPVETDTPSVGQAGSEAGEKAFPDGDGSEPVTIRIAPSSRVDDLAVTLAFAVNDPDGSTVGACGSYVDWHDGTVTRLEGPCSATCSNESGDGAFGNVEFRHTFAEAGDVEATVTIFTGEECFGDGTTKTFKFSVPPEVSD